MVPELAMTMLACARIGAVHSVVFAGFSADSLRGRIVDGESRFVFTVDEGLRGGKVLKLKSIVDEVMCRYDNIQYTFTN
jgi:acetyl-CoA synthetase